MVSIGLVKPKFLKISRYLNKIPLKLKGLKKKARRKIRFIITLRFKIKIIKKNKKEKLPKGLIIYR